MELVFASLALAVGLLLMAGSFVYLVGPRPAERLLDTLRVPLIFGIAILIAAAVVRAADRWEIVASLAAMSLVAYLIRESRKIKREKPLRLGGLERQPVLPTKAQPDGEEKEQEAP